MRVLHVTLTLSRLATGTHAFLWSLVASLKELGVESVVAGLHDDFVDQDTASYREMARIETRPAVGWWPLGLSPRLWKLVDSLANHVDVVHLHGLRNLLGRRTRVAALSAGKPLVISPHGQLEPWVLRQRFWRKMIVDPLWERRNLRAASLLHATSVPECEHIRGYGMTNPVAVVPAGVNPNQFLTEPDPLAIAARFPVLAGKRLLLFHSRLIPRKGLFALAEAWGRLAPRFPEWQLAVAGFDEHGFRRKVVAAIERAGVKDRTTFVGELRDPWRVRMLASASLFVLPTFSENFGIVVLEALASGCPVVTTTGTPWSMLPERGCGWWVDAEPPSLAGALADAMSRSDKELRIMGQRGRALVESDFTWQSVANQMHQVYIWLVRGGEKPPCILTPLQAGSR